MLITKISMLTKKPHTMDLEITKEQWLRYAEGKEYIQDIFINLNPDEREFIKTGITADEWAAACDEGES